MSVCLSLLHSLTQTHARTHTLIHTQTSTTTQNTHTHKHSHIHTHTRHTPTQTHTHTHTHTNWNTVRYLVKCESTLFQQCFLLIFISWANKEGHLERIEIIREERSSPLSRLDISETSSKMWVNLITADFSPDFISFIKQTRNRFQGKAWYLCKMVTQKYIRT